MKAQHTKGYWYSYFLDTENGWILDANDNYLAEIISSDEEGKYINEFVERKANARLIAAAPQLLELLNESLSALEATHGKQELVARIQAIKKAIEG